MIPVAPVRLRVPPAAASHVANIATDSSVPGEWALLVLFGLILLDSLEDYLLVNLMHVSFPVNALVPLFVLLVAMRWGPQRFVPPPAALLGLVLLFSAFLIGVIFSDVYGWRRLLPIGGIMVSFLIGYAAARWTRGVDAFAAMLLTIGCVYALVCVIALTKVMPELFPIINAYGFRNGELVIRPEVTIDQNFQIFYLFFIALLYFLPANRLRFAAIFIGSVAAAYTLARLYTRSGTLLYVAAMIFAWLTPVRYPHLGRAKMILLPLLLLAFATWQFDWIVGVTRQIVFRFTDTESYGTFYGRVYAAEYLFRNLFNPTYWIPQGNDEFVTLTGNIPHFTPTAMFLEGGLAGLLAWIALVPVPLCMLVKRYLEGRLDALGILICGGGLIVLGAQLSLNAPLYDHVWLWAGAVIGCLGRAPLPKPVAVGKPGRAAAPTGV